MSSAPGWRQWLRGRGAAPADGPRPVSLHWFFTRLFWVCLAPLVLLAAGLAWDRVHAVHERQTTQAEQMAAAVVARVDEVLAARMAALRVLAASPALDDPAQWQAARPLLLATDAPPPPPPPQCARTKELASDEPPSDTVLPRRLPV